MRLPKLTTPSCGAHTSIRDGRYAIIFRRPGQKGILLLIVVPLRRAARAPRSCILARYYNFRYRCNARREAITLPRYFPLGERCVFTLGADALIASGCTM